MTYDYDSFLKGLWTGLSLGRVPGGREPKPEHDPMFILTESGIYTLVEQMGEGVPIGTASSTVGCNWPLPLDLYQSAYRTHRGSKNSYVANEGCVMLVASSTSRQFIYAIASDTPGEVGYRVRNGSTEVLTTYLQYTLNERTVYWYEAYDYAGFDYEEFAPIVPDRQPDFDGRECWIAVFGDIIYGNRMITEGS